jgi:aspartyl-tRNA(Asn)/glutamyl-tRNA(Gln) amidotransferase subunit A
MLAEDVLYLPVRELAQRIKTGAVSPVELSEAYLERGEKIGRKLNAYALLMPEAALKEARQAEQEVKAGRYRGPLHGIPYAAKDLLAVKGFPTTWGARPFAKQTFDHDAAVVEKLREAGAVLLGKAATIELAGGFGYRNASASLTGACLNPWNAKHWAGGSSSGPGALTAAGLAAFALGTETWGSIVCPASFCGVSGLRPTFGRVSRRGCMSLSPTMDKIGVLARSADDCSLVLSHLAGHDPHDPSTLPDAAFTDDPALPARPLRVGWCGKLFPKHLDAKNEPVFAKAADALRGKEATVEDATLPQGPWDDVGGTVISVEAAAAFASLLDSGRAAQLTDPLNQVGGYVAQLIPAADYLRSQRIRVVLQRKIDAVFEQFDVLAAPTFPYPATPLEANFEDDQYSFPDPLGAIGNLCGLPAISVPCGFTEGKLPLGLLFVGRVLDEGKVLAAARLFQQRTDWHTRRPPVN